MELNIPKSVQTSFERSKHPFYMWEGIQLMPAALRDILSADVRVVIQQAAAAMKGKRTVHIVGCGTSYFSAMAAAHVFQSITSVPAYAQNAFEFQKYPPQLSADDVVIGISHTGGTPAVVHALQMAKKQGVYTIGYSDGVDSALSRTADLTVQSSMGLEPALPKTNSYLASVLRSYLLAVELAGLEGKDVKNLSAQLENVPQVVEEVMAACEQQAKELAGKFSAARKFVISGGGPQVATANEAALKLTEAALAISDAWELEEAMHGTWASTVQEDVVVIAAMDGPAYEKAVTLAEGMHTIDTRVWFITNRKDAPAYVDAVTVLPEGLDELFMPLAAVVPLYYFTYFLALERGVRPDNMNLADERYLKARQLMRSSL